MALRERLGGRRQLSRHALPQPPIVSVVIGSYNRARLIRDTLDTVRRELAATPHEIIVVDGGSTDGALEWLLAQKDVISIVQHNHGDWQGEQIERKSWGYFMNLGFRAASGKYICMLSDDCLLVPGAIADGLGVFEQALGRDQPVGAVAFYWRNWPDQQSYWVGYTFGDRLFVNHGLYLKEALESVGYADPDSYRFYHADGDLCLRLWEKGHACVESPTSYVEHRSHLNGSVSRAAARHIKADWKSYTDRWSKLGTPQRDWKEVHFDDPHRTAERYWGRGGRGLPESADPELPQT